MNKEKQSILYIWLPCKRIYPVGPTYLSNYIHTKRPHIRQRILDLSQINKKERRTAIHDMVEAFKPDIIAFTWRDIQIYAPHEEDRSLELAFDFYYSTNLLRRLAASIKGVSMVFNYENSIREKFFLIKDAMKSFPGRTILLGGGAMSVFSNELISRLPEGITGIIGEGEDALLAAADGTDINKHRVIYKEGGLIKSGKSGKQARPVAIEDIEIDYRYIQTIFPEVNAYFGEAIGIQTKRGCPYHCEFCLYNYIEGEHVRFRNPDAIIKEIEYLYSNWNVRKIWFADAQFIPGSTAIPQCTAILKNIINKGLPIEWSGYVRTSLVTPELARLMVSSGVGDLEISITSGSQKVLNEMSMGFKLENLYEGCRYLKKEGYRGKATLNYSINAPGETRETLLETIKSYKTITDIMGKGQVKPMIFFLGIQPHTKLEDRLIQAGYLSKSYNPISLNPFSIKKLLYNPPPLDKLIARSCLSAWKEKGDSGEKIMLNIEKALKR